MDKIRLIDCPFCGRNNTAEITTARELEACKYFESEECDCFEVNEPSGCRLFTAVCNYQKGGCGCSIGYFITAEKAAERWNTRGVSWR